MDNSLLASIQKGKKLKKAVTNDRSVVSLGGGVVEKGKAKSSSNGNRTAAPPAQPAAPQLAGPLFAGGMPKLRSVKKNESAAEPATRSAAPTPPRAPAPEVRRPPPAPKQAPAPSPVPIRRPPAPPTVQGTTNGLARMNIKGEESAVPFSAANLRKTGISMTKQNGPPPPPPPPPQPAQMIRKPSAQPTQPSSAVRAAPTIPASSGLASVNGRWKFPATDDELPAPPPFQGIRKAYPSGATTGTTVIPDKINLEPPKPKAPTVSRPPTAPTTVKKQPTKSSPVELIEQKIHSLNAELKRAVEMEEFELCIEIRGRIKKLNVLKDDAEQGFDISPAEINAA